MKKEILNNGMIRRAAVMLAVMLLTATTAWAQGVDYIDANGVIQ